MLTDKEYKILRSKQDRTDNELQQIRQYEIHHNIRVEKGKEINFNER